MNVLQNILWKNWTDANCAALCLFNTSEAAVKWPSAVFSRQSFPAEQLILADQRSHFCRTKPFSIYICFSALKDMCGHSNMCLCFKKRGVVTATLVFALKRAQWSQQHWYLLWWSPTCTLHKGGSSNQGTIPPGESAVCHFLHPDDNGARSSFAGCVSPNTSGSHTLFFFLSHRAHKILTILANRSKLTFPKWRFLCYMKTNLPSLMLWIHGFGTHSRRTTTTGTELAWATSLLSVK